MKSSKIVPEYDSKNPLIKRLFFARLKKALDLSMLSDAKESNVADFGCGDCIFLKFLEEKYKNIKTYGIDILPQVLGNKNFLRAQLKISDLNDTRFENNFFDAIFCLDTLEHFENLSGPIGEIKRTLKPGGKLVVSLPTENFAYKLGRFLLKGTFSSKKGPSSSPHFHNAKQLKRAILDNNFVAKSSKKIYPILPLTFFEIVLFEKKS